MPNKNQPRGIRNNNPGNIEYNPAVKWQGIEGPEGHPSKRFAKFKSPEYGIRALVRLLITYQDRYGLNTIEGAINRWAPSFENNTRAYAEHVSKVSGFAVDYVYNAHSFDDMLPIVKGIILHENGVQPYTDAQLTKGLVMAGLEPPVQSLQKTRTVKGGQAAMVGVAGGAAVDFGAVDALKEEFVALAPYHDYFMYGFLTLSVVGIIYMMWARIDDRRKLLR